MKAKTLQILAGCALLFSFLAAPHAQAAEWAFCESNHSGHLYYDKASIVRVGDIARVRTMAILNDDGKAALCVALRKTGKAPGNADVLSYSITSEEFDCVKRKMKITSMTIFNEKGGAVHSLALGNAAWDDVIPGTNGEILGNIVCGGSR